MISNLKDHLRRNAVLQRLLKGLGANGVSQVTLALGQFGLVPIFLAALGAKEYGVWLLVFTVPSYLALSDLGVSTNVAARVAIARAQGEDQRAADLFATARFASACLLGGAFFLFAPAAFIFWKSFLLPEGYIAAEGVILAIIMAAGYGALLTFSTLLLSPLKAEGKYHFATYLSTFSILIETISACIVVTISHSISLVSLSYFVVRAIFVGLLLWGGTKMSPYLRGGRVHRSLIGMTLRQGILTMTVPSAQAAVLQGLPLFVGASFGTPAVAVFSAARTYSRLPLQAALLLNHAMMPEFSRASGSEARQTIRAMVLVTILSCVVLSAAFIIFTSLFGNTVAHIWIGRRGFIPADILMWFACVGAVSIFWHSIMNLFLASNMQKAIVAPYLVGVVALIALVVSVGVHHGLLGVIACQLAFETTMAILGVALGIRYFWRSDRKPPRIFV